MLNFFIDNNDQILILISNNGDPVLQHKMIDALADRLHRLFTFYYKLYNQEQMLSNHSTKLSFLCYREANDIVNTLIYWIRFKEQITVSDAKRALIDTLTRSSYEIAAHGFN